MTRDWAQSTRYILLKVVNESPRLCSVFGDVHEWILTQFTTRKMTARTHSLRGFKEIRCFTRDVGHWNNEGASHARRDFWAANSRISEGSR